MAKQLLGKEVTAALNEKIKANVAELEAKGVKPTLGIIRVGEREDDLSYERGATKRCETLGVAYEKFLLPADVTQEELMATIDKVNKDDSIHGVLIFRPLPKHLDEAAVIKALSPEKDVDGTVCDTVYVTLPGEGRRRYHRRFHGRRIRRNKTGLPAMYSAGLHGDPRPLRHRLHR